MECIDVSSLVRIRDNYKMNVAVISNTSWYLYNFRLNLMLALIQSGYNVIAIAPRDKYSEMISNAGISYQQLSISGDDINPVTALLTVAKLARLLRRLKVDIVLSYTPKGNIYSGIACFGTNIKFGPNVSGLGRTFIKHSILTYVMKGMYCFVFKKASVVFFENNDDLNEFVEMKLVAASVAERLPGSGVDLRHFIIPDTIRNSDNGDLVFLLIARMLWDKGIGEFVSAAKSVLALYPNVKFQLLGFVGVQNPSAIPKEVINTWVEDGVVDYLGATDDVRDYIANSDCVILPSYREGLPRSLLEAAAMSKPIITTDVPGCRDTVDDGVNGFLCKLKDADDLRDQIMKFIGLTHEQKLEMGRRSREKIEHQFDENIVINRYLEFADGA